MIHIFQNSHIKYDIFQEVNFKYTSIFCPKRHFQYNIVIQATLYMTFYNKCHLKYELLCHISHLNAIFFIIAISKTYDILQTLNLNLTIYGSKFNIYI